MYTFRWNQARPSETKCLQLVQVNPRGSKANEIDCLKVGRVRLSKT